MGSYLDAILERKRREIEFLELEAVRPRRDDGAFSKALKTPGLSVIAELKRRSPSAGEIAEIADPVALLQRYTVGGAAAISVLTDEAGFGGTLFDLERVAAKGLLPVLRKDFILAPSQIDQAVAVGASAVLLIVAAVGQKLVELLAHARKMGIEVLVEVHTEEEVQFAVGAGAAIIGVNNRSLSTFAVDFNTALRLRPLIPEGIVTVAESGIHHPEQARLLREAGYDAVLVGHALMRAPCPEALIERIRRC